MLVLEKGYGWGFMLVIRLGCGHDVELLREWVSELGKIARVQCTTVGCRRIFDDVHLKGWALLNG